MRPAVRRPGAFRYRLRVSSGAHVGNVVEDVTPLTLDHVAFWVSDRDPIVGRCIEWLGMHTIDRQENFTLVGADARRGKLTFFDADGPRERGVFAELGLRVPDLARARAALPPGTGETFDLGEGLAVRLVEAETDLAVDLDYVLLDASDPEQAAAAYEQLGFTRCDGTRLEVGGASLRLERGSSPWAERPLLNHIAVLVESAEEHRLEAEARGIEVESTVEAANTRAVFLRAPDGVRVEFVEHKASFSLV